MNRAMSSNLVIRQYKEGDEIGIVEVLNKSFIKRTRDSSVEYWIWKHKNHPNFDPECVYVAEESGKIVGCLHAIVEDLKLGKSFLRIAYESDFAILPTHRGGRIVLDLYDAINKTLVEKGVVLKAGFTSPELTSGFYMRLFGFFNMPTVTYTKILSNRVYEEKVLEINNKLSMNESLRKELKSLNLVIQVRLRDIPSFLLRIMNGGIFIENGESTNHPDLVIVGDQGPISRALRGKIGGGNKMDLLRAILTGRVKIKGWFRSTLKLYKFFRIMMRFRNIYLTRS